MMVPARFIPVMMCLDNILVIIVDGKVNIRLRGFTHMIIQVAGGLVYK